MKPHLERAHQFWKRHLKATDHVIDATCGNGKDTAILAELVPEGHVYAIDIQQDAIEKARAYIQSKNVTFLHRCHTHLPEVQEVRLIVYNLGY
ncbi:MAG: methyltransferase domain-containing protein, partial [Rhabdochlamydiaceae bacterium]